MVLFSPSSVLGVLGLDGLRAEHQPWVGAVFVVSTLLFATAAIRAMAEMFGPIIRGRWNLRQWEKELHVLSPPEVGALREYIDNETTTRSFYLSDGVAGGLVGKNILYRASNIGHPGSVSFDYNLQPWAWRYLRKHPEILRSDSQEITAAITKAR